MIGDYYKPGAWNAICDICGLRFKSDELQKNWKGQMVCSDDFETRHPQDFIRVPKEDVSVPWVRPEGQDQFIDVCWIWERSAFADLASADCAQADRATPSYEVLKKIKEGN